MPRRRRPDPKADALRQRGTLNPRPERVRDVLFGQSAFFDAKDLAQVKYEMIRRAQVDGVSVAGAAETFGFSRPSFYAAQAALTREGLAGLLPRKRGPRAGHKLTPEILRFVEELRKAEPSRAAASLLPLVKARFGVTVHPRTVERALARQEKKRR
jgi:transposase